MHDTNEIHQASPKAPSVKIGSRAPAFPGRLLIERHDMPYVKCILNEHVKIAAHELQKPLPLFIEKAPALRDELAELITRVSALQNYIASTEKWAKLVEIEVKENRRKVSEAEQRLIPLMVEMNEKTRQYVEANNVRVVDEE